MKASFNTTNPIDNDQIVKEQMKSVEGLERVAKKVGQYHFDGSDFIGTKLLHTGVHFTSASILCHGMHDCST